MNDAPDATKGSNVTTKTVVVNVTRGAPYDVYIGRPGLFGNPYVRGEFCVGCDGMHATGAETLRCYERYLRARLKNDNEFRVAFYALWGETLGCFCTPAPCHGHVMARVLEETMKGARPKRAWEDRRSALSDEKLCPCDNWLYTACMCKGACACHWEEKMTPALKGCSHHWTTTSECPKCLREELDRAYAEIRKQSFGSRVVFDREVVERAEMAAPDVLQRAHECASKHLADVLRSAQCGCFYCGKSFAPDAIKEWIDNGQTAVCPHCGIDSVLADASRFPMTKEFLGMMYDHWFGRGSDANGRRVLRKRSW